MNRINVCLMEMTHAGNTSGVNRYVETLKTALRTRPDFCVCHLQLEETPALFFPAITTQADGSWDARIPLPRTLTNLLEATYWMERYNQQIWRIMKQHFFGNAPWLLHIHTLNLIDMALFIKARIAGSRIITHVHCIAWKGVMNYNKQLFKQLYSAYQAKTIDPKQFIRIGNELTAYSKADQVICVTQCGKEFVERMTGRADHICVIENGVPDHTGHTLSASTPLHSDSFHALYVGVLSHSKGIRTILQAMELLRQRGLTMQLTACGLYDTAVLNRLKEDYGHLSVNYTGILPYEALEKFYSTSHLGIIASVQEQSSMAAIEMMKYGLPIVTTAADGLNEMFTDRVNALKVKVRYSSVHGLYVKPEDLAAAIQFMMMHPHERIKMGHMARRTFENRFTADRMLKETVRTYQQTLCL